MAESGEEWELSKENIRPIQQGRKQKVLKVALAPHPEEVVVQQRQSFENELRTYSGDDPLFVWCKYIKWVEQSFPKGGREGHIKQLMERCLSILKDEQKYFDDERFIDIMVKYAGLSGKPLEVYNYMYSNKIGCKSAKFFINWSWELEQLGNLKKADEVLTEGLKRRAEPVENMKSYHADFEIRLASKIKANLETNNFEQESSRSAFSMLKPLKKNLAPVKRTGEAVIENKSSLILGRQQPQPRSAITSSVKVPFKIYNSENIHPSLPVQTQLVGHNSLHSENYKENERKPSKWNKVKVKPHNYNLKNINEVNPDFKFHCDDENYEQIRTPRSLPKTSTILSTRRRTPSPPIALFEPPDPMKKPMYPKNKVYGGVVEFSLEELRVTAWLEHKKKVEQEILLAEQQKKIQEQAENEEKLKKQVEYLAKKVELLQSCFTSSGTTPSKMLLNDQENKSLMQAEIKIPPKLIDDNDPDVGLPYRNNVHNNYSLTEKSTDTTDRYDTEKIVQKLYNESLFHPTDKDESNNLKKFSLFSSNNCLADDLTQADQACSSLKEPIDNLPFTFYHDPTTKIIPHRNEIVSSNDSADVAALKLNGEHNISKDSDKLPFSFFHDPTGNYISSQEFKEISTANQPDEIRSFSKESNKLPFTFYTDPIEKIVSTSNEVVSSKERLNPQDCLSNLDKASQVGEVHSTLKESNKLPFSFYQDPTSEIPNSVEPIPAKEPVVCDEQPLVLSREESEEDTENVPPKGYIQEKTKRELAGILAPSKNIEFIPLEEQELSDDSDDSDFEDGYIYQKGKQCADETLIPPSNTEQFSTAKFLASTPYVARNNKGSNVETSNRVPSSKKNTLKDMSDPSENINSDKDFVNENAISKPEIKSFKEPGLNADLKTTCHSRLPNILSVIMETSSENYSKSSSSSSSASLTKSSHDQHSAYHVSLHKQQSKLEPCEPSTLSSTSEVSNNNFEIHCENSSVMDKANNDKDKKMELYLVDFDPFDQNIIQKLLTSINLKNYKNIHYNNKSIRSIKTGENICIGNDSYAIDNLVAEGAYAKVFKASKSFEVYSYSNKLLALKVCKKANEWEFYVCSEIQRRLSEKKLSDMKNSVLNVMSAIKYTDGIVLVSEYSDLGTLLDVINFYKKQNSGIPELLVMFFTLELLHIVSRLHECNIIHGDIKPDNFLLISDKFDGNILELTESPRYLQLIDFGRAIDLNLYDKGICFTSVFSKADFKCNEMKDKKPWVFQLDWYGVLSCVHTMLFSEYMSVRKKDGIWVIEKKFKRYWFTPLWEPLFNKLLNIPGCYEEPDVNFFINMIKSKLQQNASSNFILQLSRFLAAYSERK